MSLWAEYVKERGGKEIMEDEQYFIAYHFQGDTVFIDDLHVAQEFRKQGVGRRACNIVAALAEAQGCKYMACTVFTKALNATESMAAAVAYGFRIVGSDDRFVWLRKGI